MKSSNSPHPPHPPPPPPPDVTTVSDIANFFNLLGSTSSEGQFLMIELSVLLTSVFLVMLFIHGGLRRRLNAPGWSITAMKGVYIVTPVMITYIIGLMHNAKGQNELFPVWALVLIYIYGGVDSMTSNDIRDNSKVLQYALQVTPLFFWALWLGHFFTSGPKFAVPIMVLFVLACWNAKETIQALCQSNQSRGLPEFIHHMVEYIREDRAVCKDRADCDVCKDRAICDATQHTGSNSMSGYTFFVKIENCEDGLQRTTTTQDIWECEGELLKGSKTNADRSQHLKDIVLSYALGLLLLRRFASFPLDETADHHMLLFVRDTLLDPSNTDHVTRIFRIIEVELSFVFDFFYTKLCVISSRRSHYKLRRLLCVPFFLWFGFVTLHYNAKDKNKFPYFGSSPPTSSSPIRRKPEILVTRIVLTVIAALEIWQIFMYFISYWRILFLVCDYVHGRKQQADSKKEPSSIMYKVSELRLKIREMGIRCTWAIKNLLLRYSCLGFIRKPWKREIGQYSFLENYNKVPMLHSLLKKTVKKFIEVPRVGQGKKSSVALSKEVKIEIVSTLRRITDWRQTTEERNKLPVVREASKWETTTETILIWHIATSALEYSYKPNDTGSDEFKKFTVATQISKYCAYLVTFTPDLLPDYPYNKVVFDKAVVNMSDLFNEPNPFKKLLEEPTISDGIGARNVVEQGVVLARQLHKDVMGNERGWEELATKWAELLLYASLSDNATEHGVNLAKGGEFITHLWALLTHAGVVTPQDLSHLTHHRPPYSSYET